MAVAEIHCQAGGPLRPKPNDWTAPRIAPVISPPAAAVTRLSKGPTSSRAANPPAGKPRNVTIQRAMVRAVLLLPIDASATAVRSGMVTPCDGEGRIGGVGVLGRDPGGQQAVRVVGKVFADERVEQ